MVRDSTIAPTLVDESSALPDNFQGIEPNRITRGSLRPRFRRPAVRVTISRQSNPSHVDDQQPNLHSYKQFQLD